jgi:riboflavin transporter FmnP
MRKTGLWLRRLAVSAMLLAAALLLPFLTGQIPEIGNMLLPMHLPILLCGLLCGAPYGAAVGLVAPLLRYAIFGMPPLVPKGHAMAVELATYGAVSGILARYLPKRIGYLYLSLGSAMLIGRVAWGGAMLIIMGVRGGSFGLTVFMTEAFTNALPGILLQLILIPVIIHALRRARLDLN